MQTTILIGLFICHFLADYTHLSTSWMLNAKRYGEPIIPIISHACVHGLLMGIVLAFYVSINQPMFWSIILFQIYSHFMIDLLKGKVNLWFPSVSNPANKIHWIVFGFDQLLHALVIIGMSLYAVS